MRALFTAAKVRYQHRHWPTLHDLHTNLLDTFEDISLSDAARGTRSHWQSPPLIINIIEGADGRQFSDDENTSSLIADVLADAIANEAKIQNSIYTALHRTYCNSTIFSTLARRCNKYFSHELVSPFENFESIDFVLVFSLLHKMENQISVTNLKAF